MLTSEILEITEMFNNNRLAELQHIVTIEFFAATKNYAVVDYEITCKRW